MCNFGDPFGLCPPKDKEVEDCASVQYWRRAAAFSSSIEGRIGNTIMAGFAAVGEGAVAEAKGYPVGDCGTKYACGMVPPIGPGGGLEEGMAKAVEKAQGAEVIWTEIGKFTRAEWELAGKKGAGFVRWSRTLDEEGRTIRLFKDVYDQGANFLRRDWYKGGPPK